MRRAYSSTPLLAALALLSCPNTGCTCETERADPVETVDDPETPEMPEPPDIEPALLTGRRAVDGGFFEVSVPESWTARRTLRATILEAPGESARLRVIVGRPVPFEGDAAAYAEALRPVFERAGFEGDPGHAGVLGDVPAQIVDGVSTGATARYWFVAVDGHGTSLSCTGRVAPPDQIQAACDDIAQTFRLTGSMAELALFEDESEIVINGFHFTRPEGWELFDPGAQAGVVAALRRSATDEEAAPDAATGMGVTLSAPPFAGDLAALRSQAEATATEDGHSLQISDGTLLAQPAAAYEVNQPAELGGRRARVIETVSGGRAVRLTCYSSPDAFGEALAACDAIATSLRE